MPVVTFEDLRVTSGPCQDPRLAAIDLRGRLRAVQLRATDAKGQPIRDEKAFVLAVSRDTHWEAFSLRQGAVELLAAGPIDVLVVAPGHRAARIEAVTADCVVPLQHAAEACIAVKSSLPLPEGTALQLRLQPTSGFAVGAKVYVRETDWQTGLGQFLRQSARVDENGVAVVPVQLPGLHDVDAQVDRYTLSGLQPESLDLPAEGGEFSVQLPERTLRPTLERLQKAR